MPGKREKVDQIFCIPISKSVKAAIVKLAQREERRPADMGRILLKIGLKQMEAEALVEVEK